MAYNVVKGIVIGGGGENASTASRQADWEAFMTASPDRLSSYRPTGVKVGLRCRLNWDRFYADEDERPEDPDDYTDPAYDFSIVGNYFGMDAVQVDGALIWFDIRDIGEARLFPDWLANVTYDGEFISTGGVTRYMPKYYRYSGPDINSNTNVGVSPYIVDEFISLHRALRDYIVANGWEDKVMGFQFYELYGGGGGNDPPADFNDSAFYHGAMIRIKRVAELWDGYGVPCYQSSMTGFGSTALSIMWEYAVEETAVGGVKFGSFHPDLKFNNTTNNLASRFTDYNTGVFAYGTIPLAQGFEIHGYRASLYFDSAVTTPWSYSNESQAKTATMDLWACCGSPQGTDKDSDLGQSGDDPAGLMPVDVTIIDNDGGFSYSDWHTAFDTLGPPGTFATPPNVSAPTGEGGGGGGSLPVLEDYDTNTGSGSTSVVVNVDLTTESNRKMIIEIANEAGSLRTISSVIFDSGGGDEQAASVISSAGANSSSRRIAKYYIDDADLPASGNYDVTVTLSGTGNTVVGVNQLSGAAQGSIGVATAETGFDSEHNISITTSVDNMIVVQQTYVSAATTIDQDDGQSENYEVSLEGDKCSGGELDVATAAATDIGCSWTSDGNKSYLTSAIAVAGVAANSAPVITSNGGGATASINVNEGTTTVTTVTATDADANDTLNFTLSGDDALLFSINQGSNNGLITFKTAPDYDTPLDANADNDYEITVTVSDSVASVTQDLTISVQDVTTYSITSSVLFSSGSVVASTDVSYSWIQEDEIGAMTSANIIDGATTTNASGTITITLSSSIVGYLIITDTDTKELLMIEKLTPA